MNFGFSFRKRARLCVLVSHKNSQAQFWPPKDVCDRKMKGRHNQGGCLVAMGMVSGRLSARWCLNKEGRMITRTKFVWHSNRGCCRGTHTHAHTHTRAPAKVCQYISLLVASEVSALGREAPLAASLVSTFSHQSRFNDRSTCEDIDESIKKHPPTHWWNALWHSLIRAA